MTLQISDLKAINFNKSHRLQSDNLAVYEIKIKPTHVKNYIIKIQINTDKYLRIFFDEYTHDLGVEKIFVILKDKNKDP